MKQQIIIDIPNGFEIDIEKSNLSIGQVAFKPIKPVKEKYPMSVNEIKGRDWYVDLHGIIQESKCPTIIDLKTRELASAFLALMQLKTICDEWNRIDGFVPDFSNQCQAKYGVGYKNNELGTTYLNPYYIHSIVFQDEETAKLFIRSFRELLETAKPLL